mgnify:CR=1 FL=1
MINKHLKKMITFYKKYLNMSLLLLLLFVSLFIILQVCTLWVSERGFIDRLNAKHNSTSKPYTIILRYQYSIDINQTLWQHVYKNETLSQVLVINTSSAHLLRNNHKTRLWNYSARLQTRLLSWTINRTFVIRRLLYSSL